MTQFIVNDNGDYEWVARAETPNVNVPIQEICDLLNRTTSEGIVMKREDLAAMRGCFIQMLDAIKSGNIDSPWLSGEPEVGIPPHKWHEEWEYYAGDMLSILETALEKNNDLEI